MKGDAKPWMIGLVVLLLAGGLAWWMLSGGYKLSESGYQYAMALVSVCTREDSERLEIVVQQVEAAVTEGKLPEEDGRRLLAIAATAQEGNWKSASSSIRKLMEQQVEQVD